MIKKYFYIFSSILSLCYITLVNGLDNSSTEISQHINANLESIDVVIPCIDKDLRTLSLCIQSIKKYCKNVRRIIVISSKRLTDEAEWFDEKQFEFSKYDIAYEIFQNQEKALEYIDSKGSRVGWIYQQLLKLYACLTIPDIESNVLVVDADTIFFKPVSFFDSAGRALYNIGTEYHPPYFEHMQRLLPGLRRVYPHYSGITNHMLFQRQIIEILFQKIEQLHKIEFWRAMCRCIDHNHLFHSACSEFEIYFNFIFDNQEKVLIRPLKWTNTQSQEVFEECERKGDDYVSLHSYEGYLP